MDTLRAANAVANAAPVVQVITEWRHTAEVHADPELAARIGVPVPLPGYPNIVVSDLR